MVREHGKAEIVYFSTVSSTTYFIMSEEDGVVIKNFDFTSVLFFPFPVVNKLRDLLGNQILLL